MAVPIFSCTRTSIPPSPRNPEIPHSSVLTLMSWLQDHSTDLTCQLTFPGVVVTVKRTLQLETGPTQEVQNPFILEMLLLLHLLWAGSLAQDGRFHLQIQRPVTVEEGLCVQVPCSVFYPNYGLNSSTPAYGYWFRDGADVNLDAPVATNNPDRKVQKETQGRFRLVGNPHIYDCSLEIGEAQKGDTGTYFFRVERGHFVRYTYLENKLSVHVAALTQTPNIHIQGILEVDHPKKITCTVPWTCKKETPPTFSWIGVDLTSLGPKAPHSSVLILTPKLHHHGTNLTCQVTLSGVGVTMKRTIQLNVSCGHRLDPKGTPIQEKIGDTPLLQSMT
ncbi:myeloid cell surface antigen CD33-like [Orycteropus afer afer]|uniref:Myeloid cell surface antigen CD33-like n=1 Tax=Orycteropus afer afer TaxID=1230840 RepID=A0AC54ZFX6_ORYAF|nr:myeloid cell surface antigen CD33-like [Orycteropus afer afer]